jgi:predicted amidophosphoribosyltransferase
MLEEKFVCPFCGFESNGPGLCPTCDKNLEKVCHCGSGKFSADCCGASTEEEKKTEELIKAEVSGEALTEIAKEDEEKLKEEEELANVKPVDEE